MSQWPNVDAHLDGENIPHGAPTWGQTECGVECGHTATSLHPLGRARDYGNLDFGYLDNEACDRIFRALEPYAQGPGYILQELFWNPLGCWQKGNRIGPVDGHDNHVHAGLALNKYLPVKEPPPPPKPKSNPGVIGMLCRSSDGWVYLIGPGHVHHVPNEDEMNRLRFVGVPLVDNMAWNEIYGWADTFGVPADADWGYTP